MRVLQGKRGGLLVVVSYVFAYLLLDWVSYIHPIAPYAITPWNPPPGVSLALLLRRGLRYAPALFVASALAEFVVRDNTPTAEILVYGLVLAVGYTGVAAALRVYPRFDPQIDTLRDLSIFTATVAIGAALVAAAYIAAHVAMGRFSWNEFPAYVLQFWVGDVIGVIVTTPLLLVVARHWRRAYNALNWETALQAAALALPLLIIFQADDATAPRHFYLLFLPLIWVSVRHGYEGATAALFATQVGLIVAMQLAGYTTSSVLELQLLMPALAVTGLFLGMAVSQWHNARQDLERREAVLQTVVSTAPDAILTIDDTLRIVAVNHAAETMLAASAAQLTGAQLPRIVVGLPANLTQAHALEARAVRLDGSSFPVELSIGGATFDGRTLYIGIMRDMSQRRHIEDQLRERDRELNRAMRIAAAAEMASALAHELNQPLTAASSYVQACDIMLQQGGAQQRLFDAMTKAVAEVKRAAEVVRRLRDFYRGGTLRARSVTVDTLIGSVLHTVHDRLQRHGVHVTTRLAPDLPPVYVDAMQLEMVLHNLVANAIDSVTGADCMRRDIAIEAAPGAPGFVRVAVEDSGPGVDETVAQQLFHAFATSKATGMGMGLAISRSIVEQHGGRLWLDDLRPGARFVLTLPVAKASA